MRDRAAAETATNVAFRAATVADAIDQVRVLVVAGIFTGVVVVGIGSRLAMLLLRLTSPDSVHGVVSDDGFIIGRVTLGGTYNLLNIGAAVGLIGACAYRLVAPWLIGPSWFRRCTTAAAAAAVAGSMLVHAHGVDFTLLKPTWLAIGVFIALPALFAVAIGMSVDRMARSTAWSAQGRRRWIAPMVLVLLFPLSVLFIAVVAAVVAVSVGARRLDQLERLRNSTVYGFAVRGVWLSIAVVGLIAVVHDVAEIV